LKTSITTITLTTGIVVPATASMTEAQNAEDFKTVVVNGQVTITDYTGSVKDVRIPDRINGFPVTSIGAAAFWDNRLTSVTIPDSVTSIGDQAFDTDVTIIQNGRTISGTQDGLFYILLNETIAIWQYTGDAENVHIPDSINGFPVTTIGEAAFAFTELTRAIIPNSVTSIGDMAFLETPLTSITIPNSVTSIMGVPFYDCSSLAAIAVDVRNPIFSSVDGVLFSKDMKTLIAYPGGKSHSYTIPNSITSIGDAAFAGTQLTSVTIPDSVTSIGDQAFAGTQLTSVTIPNSVTFIGDRAFDKEVQIIRE
jgi:hypothetical protein